MDWTGIKISTAPIIEPITVSELKLFLRVDDSAYDTMLSGFISAAREAVELYTGRTMINTTYELYFDEFPEEIKLLRPPVQSVTSVKYIDSNGVEQTLSSSLYRVDAASLMGRIIPAYGQVWPTTQDVSNAVKITYVAGYGSVAANVPAALKECIKSICADLFLHPESSQEVNLAENKSYRFLLNAYKIPVIG